MEQRVQGTLQIWAEPFVTLRVPKLFNLRTDPFERADITSNTYYDWLLESTTTSSWRPRSSSRSSCRRSRSSRRARRRRASRSTRWWPSSKPSSPRADEPRVLERRRRADGDPRVRRPRDRGGRRRTTCRPPSAIAVLDNDGTLWCEKPTYIQALFVFARLREAVAARPELAEQPVVKALLAGDLAGAQQYGLEAIAGVLLELDAGLTTEEFTRDAAAWLAAASTRASACRSRELTYAPMLELLDAAARRTGSACSSSPAAASSSSARSASELYGVDARRRRRLGRAGRASSAATGASCSCARRRCSGSPNEGPPKAVNIQAPHRPPPDLRRRQQRRRHARCSSTRTPATQPSLCLVVDHDDAEREYAYARRGA